MKVSAGSWLVSMLGVYLVFAVLLVFSMPPEDSITEYERELWRNAGNITINQSKVTYQRGLYVVSDMNITLREGCYLNDIDVIDNQTLIKVRCE